MAVKGKWIAAVAAVVVVGGAAGGVALASGSGDYTLQLVMPNAANLVASSPVEINGFDVGKVTGMDTRDGKALVTVSVQGDKVPLHSGTKAQIQWKSVLGERVVELLPGPAGNPAIPSGSMVEAGNEQVELDQVLAALDPPTRAHVDSLVQQLKGSLDGHQNDLQQTLRDAGPVVQALGQILRSVGSDGPAIQSLVSDLKNMADPLAARQAELQQVVDNFSSATAATAPEQQQLSQALGQLSSTLGTARSTLDLVPGAADQAVPLLNDLRPATSKLGSVAQSLSPLLTQLRPTIAQLGPTLAAANTLLQDTPQLLDSSHATLPGVNQAVAQLNPAVNFLRPYTPDLIGWLANWGSAFSNYDAQGHFFRGLIQVGASALNDNPGLAPGFQGGPDSTPAPGTASGQPWTDANGSGMR